ncbi:hypothetical protein [Micromonospora robiginosa]|uniref:Uncharacterized protein n=1 Tax=Micromonospora robiginosa TaxID=2749844 RepID=A0A7L6B218_9ACTN|nr:hypothetical protein [Micromonospora ferruginea]QLQ36019.1 hypothetical protein H1D33_22110 [Micromonospora ferruginea]
MTRPEEPTEALPTRALPADGDATVYLGSTAGDSTVPFGAPTVPADGDATVYLGSTSAEPTVPVGGAPAGGEPTVHLAAPRPAGGQPTAPYRPTATGPAVPTAGATAGAYRQPTVTGGSAPAPGGELRFGPGVPATPPPAPAWPAAPPVRPPRPAWRRVVSVLSTLLTAALLVTVGLYLWQRLRPLEVEGVSVAVPRPAGVACDVTVDVVATVRTNGRAGTIRYQWFRSDAPPGALLTERVGSGQRTATLTLRWTFSGVGATTGTATVNLVEPSPVQAGTRVAYRCPGG